MNFANQFGRAAIDYAADEAKSYVVSKFYDHAASVYRFATGNQTYSNWLTNHPQLSGGSNMPFGTYRKKRFGRAFRSYNSARRPARRPMRRYSKSYASMNKRTGGFRGIELKFFDTSRTPIALTTAWTTNTASTPLAAHPSTCSLGTGEEQHIGRVYTIKSMFIRFRFDVNPETGATPLRDLEFRVAVVWDKQTNGAPAAGFVFDTGTSDDLSAFQNLQNSHRFDVLWDSGVQTIVRSFMNSSDAVGNFETGAICRRLNMYKKFPKGIRVQTDGPDADIADVTDNSIYVISIGDSAAVNMSWESRMRFTG